MALSILLAIGLSKILGSYYSTQQEAQLQEENQELKAYFQVLDKDMNELKEMMQALQNRDDNIYRVVFEAESIPNSIRQAGSGGSEKYQELLKKGLKNEELIVETKKKIDALKRKMYIQSKSHDEIIELAKTFGFKS